MFQFLVDKALCNDCGLCATDCVAGIIEMGEGGLPLISPEKREQCCACQHCLAVCPTGAISVLGKNPADSKPMSEVGIPSPEQMDDLIRSRRSIRHYRDANVDPALISSLLKTLAHAPTGVNKQELTFSVIDDKEVMRAFSGRMIAAMVEAVAKDDASERYGLLAQVASLPEETVSSMLFRGAPHALIVSAPADAPCADQDVALSLAYFELLAQSAGLGTVWWGLLRYALTVIPEMKSVLGIPGDHVFYAMLFGLPAIKFARTTQKEDVAVVRRVELTD